MATSEALDRETAADPPSVVDQTATPDDDADRDPPDLAGASDMPGSGAES